MNRVVQSVVGLVCLVSVGLGVVQAEQTKATPAMSPEKEAAMALWQKASSPSEGHKALEPFVGTWTYTAQWWVSPNTIPEAMTGTTTNSLIFGGRFLQQTFRGEAQGYPPFDGLGLTGYDNIRQEYQSVWLDNMGTGLMTSTGQFDAATQTMTETGDFSCPMTGEAHRKFRAVWKTIDPTHNSYTSYSFTPDGTEFKSMEILYTKSP